MSMDFETAHFNRVEQPIRIWDGLDPVVPDACSQVAPDLSVPAAYRNLAYADTEIELGHGQCMMSPKIEAPLLQSSGIRSPDRVLEVGTGRCERPVRNRIAPADWRYARTRIQILNVSA